MGTAFLRLLFTSTVFEFGKKTTPAEKRRKIKMMQMMIIVLLAVAGAAHAGTVTSTGVDLAPIFEFLDDNGDAGISSDELKALTVTGDADGNGQVTAAEFQESWQDIAVSFGVAAEKHAKYFKLVDGVDGTAEDGVITDSENVALFKKFDTDNNKLIDIDEFVARISSVVS